MINKWDLRFMALAHAVAPWSKDTRTKVGSIIVNDRNPISMGFNGPPCGCNDNLKERLEAPLKYMYMVHSEANSLIQSAKNGQKTDGCTMYVTLFPCSNCAGLIVNAGIKRVVCNDKPDFNNEKYGESWRITLVIFEEAGIQLDFINE
jgi:dCMP deaminase